MSEHDELRAALRQANAELEVSHPNWTTILAGARKRLAVRIGAVATLALAGSLLLLGGGLTGRAAFRAPEPDQPVKKRKCKSGERRVGKHCERIKRCRKHAGKWHCEEPGRGNCHKEGRKRCRNPDDGHTHDGKRPQKKPNLVVSLIGTKVVAKNDSPVGAETFEVTVTTEREGEPSASESKTKKALPPHRTWKFKLACVAGDHLTVEVDSGHQIAESDEHDNVSEGECQPPERPNLVVAIEGGQVVVRNDSSVDAGPFDVRVMVEPVEGESTEPPVLNVESLAAAGAWEHGITCNAGDLVTVEVDASKQVDESNEEDNTIEREKCPADETPPSVPTQPSTTPDAKSPSETTSPSTEPIG